MLSAEYSAKQETKGLWACAGLCVGMLFGATARRQNAPLPNFVIEMAIVHLGESFPTFVITNDGVDGMFDRGGKDKCVGSSQRVTRPKAGSTRCRDTGDGPDIAQHVEQEANCCLGLDGFFSQRLDQEFRNRDR